MIYKVCFVFHKICVRITTQNELLKKYNIYTTFKPKDYIGCI